MDKLNFIVRQLARTKGKPFESYAIQRIWHLLNSTDIKIVTQQYIRRKAAFSLTDLYFPQLDLHIEIDEKFHDGTVDIDNSREADIIDATNHEVKRIKVSEDLTTFNNQIDEMVQFILEKRTKLIEKNKFESWDPEQEFNPLFYRNKGYLDIEEKPAFRRIVDAANCLGQNAKGYQQAFFRSKVYDNHHLWFPKLYKNAEWNNSISQDEDFIFEKPLHRDLYQHLEDVNKIGTKRIVFPRVVDNLGFVLYRFKGIYKFDYELSNLEEGAVYRRIEKRFEI